MSNLKRIGKLLDKLQRGQGEPETFFHRWVGFLTLGVIAVSVLLPIDHPWARYAAHILLACLFVGTAALLLIVTLRQTKWLSASERSEAHFASGAVVACVLLSVVTAAILLFVAPPKQCPNWHLPDRGSTRLWTLFLLWTVPLVVIQVFMIIRWNWAVEKTIESTDYPVTYILVTMVLGFCGVSQIPLSYFVTRCWLEERLKMPSWVQPRDIVASLVWLAFLIPVIVAYPMRGKQTPPWLAGCGFLLIVVLFLIVRRH